MPPATLTFGSQDSTDKDVVYVYPSVPSRPECKAFCDGKGENRNIIAVEQGVVQDCYKGLPDEMNNALWHTYRLHPQEAENPIERPVRRIVPLKALRAIRIILSNLSRTRYRPRVKEALGSYDFAFRKEILADVSFRTLDLPVEAWKTIAFQLGQTIALVRGEEFYTKQEIADSSPELGPFLRREGTVAKAVIDEHRDQLLALLGGIYTRRKRHLNLFCYENGPAIKDWNGFATQSRGMILDAKRERCVQYPADKFFRIDEVPDTEEVKVLQHGTPEIAEKLDGSMVSCYEHDGAVQWACKGNFEIEQSRKAAELAPLGLDLRRRFYVFELIYPENRYPTGMSIIDYGDREGLYLVFLRDRLTNEALPYAEVVEEAKRIGVGFPEIEERGLEELIAVTREEPGELRAEGWVARFADDFRVKIKYPAYMAVLSKVNDLRSGRAVKRFVEMEEDWDVWVTGLPEDLREEALRPVREFMERVESLKAHFDRVIASHDLPQWAIEHLPRTLQKPFFKYWRGRANEGLLRKAAFRMDQQEWEARVTGEAAER